MERKELKKAYLESKRPMGVYGIINRKTGKVHIGYAKDLNARFNRHKAQLKFGSHIDKDLQETWNTFGESELEFKTLDLLDHEENKESDYVEELKLLSEMWIQKLVSEGKSVTSFKNG